MCCIGKYSVPHIISMLNERHQTIFEVLEPDNEVTPLHSPFQAELKNKAMKQLEGMNDTLRIYISSLAARARYWIFHKDGDNFDLKVSDPKSPSYQIIANDPKMESIIGVLNALILSLDTNVNESSTKTSCRSVKMSRR